MKNPKDKELTLTPVETPVREDSWGYGSRIGVCTPKITKLSHAQYRWLMNFDEPLDNTHSQPISNAHKGIITKIPSSQETFYVPGAPIRTVKFITKHMRNKILSQLGLLPPTTRARKPVPLKTKEQICADYDLRPEWLEDLINKNQESYSW
jgi:hypothetical protein